MSPVSKHELKLMNNRGRKETTTKKERNNFKKKLTLDVTTDKTISIL